jgi:hypothetical protein
MLFTAVGPGRIAVEKAAVAALRVGQARIHPSLATVPDVPSRGLDGESAPAATTRFDCQTGQRL